VKVRDLPISGRPMVLVWAKRLRRAEICRRVGQDEDSAAEVARVFGVGWHSAMAAVIEHGTPLVPACSR
jgi:hypothetical protein